jgi:hypothetical protein
MLQIVFFLLVFGKLSMRRGCMGFGSTMFGLVVQKFLNIEMISSLKINLN